MCCRPLTTFSLLLPLLVWRCTPEPAPRQIEPRAPERAVFAAPG